MQLFARRYRVRLALLFCMTGAFLPAPARATANDMTWLCWMTSSAAPVIRCSLEKTDQAPPLIPKDAKAEDVLEMLQARFHEGATVQDMERLLQVYGSPAVAKQIMTIPLYTIPFESSWREQRPQQLVHALLCKKGSRCRIRLRRP